MSINISGQIKVIKDDRGFYRTNLSKKEINQLTGEEETVFMGITVGFRKGVDIKNRTKIDVKEGFLTFFRTDTGKVRENNTPIYNYYPKLMILSFDIVEDGDDTVCTYKGKKTAQDNPRSSETVEEYIPQDYFPSELPF